MNSPPLIERVRFAAPRGVNPAPVLIELGGARGAPPRPPARVFRGGELNSPPLILRVRFAAPRGVNPAPLAALALCLLFASPSPSSSPAMRGILARSGGGATLHFFPDDGDDARQQR